MQDNGMRNWTTSCHVLTDKSGYGSLFITDHLPLLVRLCGIIAYGQIDPTTAPSITLAPRSIIPVFFTFIT